jgi:hypothetical protein
LNRRNALPDDVAMNVRSRDGTRIGAALHVFENLNHLELVTAVDVVGPVVELFIRAAIAIDEESP